MPGLLGGCFGTSLGKPNAEVETRLGVSLPFRYLLLFINDSSLLHIYSLMESDTSQGDLIWFTQG